MTTHQIYGETDELTSEYETELQKVLEKLFEVSPTVESELSVTIRSLKQTYVMVAGLEHEMAFRIQTVASDFSCRFEKVLHIELKCIQSVIHSFIEDYIPKGSDTQKRISCETQHILEWYLYKQLHPIIWEHLTSNKEFKKREEIVNVALRSFGDDSCKFLAQLFTVPIQFAKADLTVAASVLRQLENCKTPFDKLQCFSNVAEYIPASTDQTTPSATEHLAFYIVLLFHTNLKQPVAHAAHVEMLLSQRPLEVRQKSCVKAFAMYQAAVGLLYQKYLQQLDECEHI